MFIHSCPADTPILILVCVFYMQWFFYLKGADRIYTTHSNSIIMIYAQFPCSLTWPCTPGADLALWIVCVLLHVIFVPIALNIITRRAGNCKHMCVQHVCALCFRSRITMRRRRHSFGSKSEGGPLQLLPSIHVQQFTFKFKCRRVLWETWTVGTFRSCIIHLSLSLWYFCMQRVGLL